MKKLLLFFGLICMINLMSAQETVTIHQNGHDFQVSAVRSVTDYPASNIQFWVGNGSNSVVAVFKWCQNTTMGIAYGYRWDGSATIYDMLTGIAAADSRFTVTFNSSNTFINNIVWNNDTNLHIDSLLSLNNFHHCAVEGDAVFEDSTIVWLSSENEHPQGPRFKHPSLTQGIEGYDSQLDWHLMRGSACINAGQRQ